MMRLDKLLAHSGYGSRKEVKELIRKGYVSVNGCDVFDDDFKVDETLDEITILDETIDYKKMVYIMLNKPQDVVSATYDPRYKTVVDLVGSYASQRVFPVGRLDIDTEGLLIITNDGQLAHKLLAPKSHVNKSYYVEFDNEFKALYHQMLKEGVTLDDGYVCLPASFEEQEKGKGIITIHEGKYHQVKRMFEALGMKVTYLKRITFGSLALDENLALGEYRLLTLEEVDILTADCNKTKE